jgi:hypothetical protein
MGKSTLRISALWHSTGRDEGNLFIEPIIMRKTISAISLAILFVAPSLVFAAKLSVTANPSVVLGQSFQVNVALDTQGDDANAIQGELMFPPGLFTLEGINDGASPVSLWIEAPHETSPGTISFSGIIPGGFTGTASSVVGIVLVPVATGAGEVGIQNAQLLRNDGQGSAIALATMGQTVAIVSSSASGAPSGPSTPFTVPERFMPVVAQDPNIYGGKYFLVFSTTDKGSGIDHYDVTEVPAGTALGQNPSWIEATSPYLLKDQTLSSDIYVRAVNNGGSATVAKVSARFPSKAASRTLIFDFASAMAAMLLILTIFFVMRIKRRRSLLK